jgi:hypothetical protein
MARLKFQKMIGRHGNANYVFLDFLQVAWSQVDISGGLPYSAGHFET